MSDGGKVAEKPWEDTLILAFRDMQWIRKIQDAERAGQYRYDQPPPLLIKLDGKAESAAGDVLAKTGARYFLLEFKSSSSQFYTEKNKPVYDLLSGWHPQQHNDLIQISTRGHFLVYPSIESTSHIQLNKIHLKCVSYYGVVKKTKDDPLKGADAFENTYYKSDGGVTLVEISRYLKALATASGADEGGPFKAVIASSNGMFWPIGKLSDFKSFILAIDSQIAPKTPGTTKQQLEQIIASTEHYVSSKHKPKQGGGGLGP